MLGLQKVGPVKPRSFKCCDGVGIRNSVPSGRVIELGKTRELIPAPGGDSLSQIFLKVAEEEKRSLCTELFAHKQHGRRRRQQQNRHCRAQCARIGESYDSLAESP